MAGMTPDPVAVVAPTGRSWLGPVVLVMAATAISRGSLASPSRSCSRR